MRDDDELRTIRVAAEEVDETSDVRIVERGLDLVEQVERARFREEQGEQERDRAERLLAAGEEREPCNALPGRPQLDFDAGLGIRQLLVRLDEREAALTTWEQRCRYLLEVARDSAERLREPALHGLGQLVA